MEVSRMSNGYWQKAFKTIALVLILGASLTGCEFSSKEELIEAYGKTIGQDGYMTKDDYVIKWPAVHQGDVVAPPLTLKIPKKWLRVTPLADSAYSKDREDGSIISIYVMSSIPGPKPYIEPFPWPKKIPYAEIVSFFSALGKERPPRSKEELEKRAISAESHRNSVSVGIFRGTSSISFLFGGLKEFRLDDIYDTCYGLTIGQHYEKSDYGCLREADIDGLESYVRLICYSQEQLNGTNQKFYAVKLQHKAADDNSPDNCFINREDQSLKTPPSTHGDDQVIINCRTGVCFAEIPFYKRRVEVAIEISLNVTHRNYHLDLKHPMRNEIYTELPGWREKVDVARKLVNSFVVAQPKT